MTMGRFDPCYLKYISQDETRLQCLYTEHFEESPPGRLSGSQVMKRIFSRILNPEKFVNFLSLPPADYMVVLLDVGLVQVSRPASTGSRASSTGSTVGSIAVRGDGVEWSCGLDLSSTEGTVQPNSANM